MYVISKRMYLSLGFTSLYPRITKNHNKCYNNDICFKSRDAFSLKGETGLDNVPHLLKGN